MNTLKKIIEDKKPEIPNSISKAGLEKTQKNVLESLKRKNRLSLIAEIKRMSPSKGSIRPDMSVSGALDLYSGYANGISVLTEKNYFGGSLEDLLEASRITSIPLLRKDFLTQPSQVVEARKYGADFYLLIVAALEKGQLEEMIHAGEEWNMPALVEVHTEEELETALDLKVNLLGINNRSLKDLSIDLKTTPDLVKRIPDEIRKNTLVISESGLKSKEDLNFIDDYSDGVLIGTAFMRASEPEKLLKEMFGE